MNSFINLKEKKTLFLKKKENTYYPFMCTSSDDLRDHEHLRSPVSSWFYPESHYGGSADRASDVPTNPNNTTSPPPVGGRHRWRRDAGRKASNLLVNTVYELVGERVSPSGRPQSGWASACLPAAPGLTTDGRMDMLTAPDPYLVQLHTIVATTSDVAMHPSPWLSDGRAHAIFRPRGKSVRVGQINEQHVSISQKLCSFYYTRIN